MRKIFTDHPHSIGETYLEHCVFASRFGFKLLCAGCVCLIHAIFPFIFQKTASNMLIKMLQIFLERMPASVDKQRVLAEISERAHQ